MTVLRATLWAWGYLALKGRCRCGSALFPSIPGELLSCSLLGMVPDSHSLPNFGHFWGQLGGMGWIHIRDHANNLSGWTTELWCPRTCLWPVSVTGVDALIGSQRYLDAPGISGKHVAEYLQTYLSLGYFWFPAAPWPHAEGSPAWAQPHCLFPFSLYLGFSQTGT